MQISSVELIQARAYQLWEEEGRPEGKDLEHWTRAASELAASGNGAQPVAPEKPAAKAKAPARRTPAKARETAATAAPAKGGRKSTKSAK